MFRICVRDLYSAIVQDHYTIHNSFITGIFFQIKIALCRISCVKKSEK